MSLSEDQKVVAKVIAHFTLDYVRWTQLVPMVLGWAFAIIMVLALLLVAFQGEIDALLSRAEPTIERWLGTPPEAVQNEPSGSSETISLNEDDIMPWIYRIWGGLAFIGWIFSMVRTKIFGPKPARRLRRKIFLAGMASLIFVALLTFGTLVMGGVTGNTRLELMVPFVLLPLLLFIVSTWGISISHIISKIQDEIEKLGETDRADEQLKTTV
ncbi:MAG: hypothetical protein JJU37_16300 [Balneolaceae bacterium]|nr:hypothetical protein [Balneolaceae bacterium]